MTNRPTIAHRRLVSKLMALVLVMFGFGYLLVPLYNVFCEVTGLNGKTGRLTVADAAAIPVDSTRLVTVEFVTSVNSGFPWGFRPAVSRVEVYPGVETEVMFEATNKSPEPLIGQAVPSVAPHEAARFFSKTESLLHTANPYRRRNQAHAGPFRGQSQITAEYPNPDARIYVFSVDRSGVG